MSQQSTYEGILDSGHNKIYNKINNNFQDNDNNNNNYNTKYNNIIQLVYIRTFNKAFSITDYSIYYSSRRPIKYW